MKRIKDGLSALVARSVGLAGLTLISVGAFLVWVPLGFFVAGAALLLVDWSVEK